MKAPPAQPGGSLRPRPAQAAVLVARLRDGLSSSAQPEAKRHEPPEPQASNEGTQQWARAEYEQKPQDWPPHQLPDCLGSQHCCKGDPAFVNRLSGLVRHDPVELASLDKGIPSPHFKLSVPPLGLSMATLHGLQSFHHTFTVTNDLQGQAFLQSPQNGQEFSSIDRLPTAKERQPRSFTSVSDIANPASPAEPSVQTLCSRAQACCC
eukprot:2795654-Amphidinium_carterae.1